MQSVMLSLMLSLLPFPRTLTTPHLQVDGQEWSFGYCERGSGVYTCTPRQNPMYTFRSAVELGPTGRTSKEVRRKVRGQGSGWAKGLLLRVTTVGK